MTVLTLTRGSWEVAVRKTGGGAPGVAAK